MSKEALQKYASLSQANKKKCFALGGWCNRQGNIFSMQEVFDCLYDAAGGNALGNGTAIEGEHAERAAVGQ